MLELGRFQVLPLYAQVEISDAEAKDYPQWPTGREPVVFLAQSIAVSTIGDREGRVTIHVIGFSEDILPADFVPANLHDVSIVFDGSLVVSGDDVVVGNTVASDLHRIRVGNGGHRVLILAVRAPKPSELVVLIAGVSG